MPLPDYTCPPQSEQLSWYPSPTIHLTVFWTFWNFYPTVYTLHVWFPSLSILSPCCFTYYWVVLFCWTVFCCVNALQLIYFTGDGRLSHFQVGAIMNKCSCTCLLIFYRHRGWSLLPSLLVGQLVQNHFSLLLFSSVTSVNVSKYWLQQF